ncbi:MAG: 3-oxoacyl-ACP reductase family protein [Planctomycetota bacterium]|jgi:NAD(P)-dependent dehydrogenase (short-subunit alcohol dehydrogenase family)|nr:3-oxoacyl-ACP reductase family protein [Planctomycetota bacterium]MDP7249666.1 3-oxoacyl-ACP reductase family protein [Planctomycetota bacterium]
MYDLKGKTALVTGAGGKHGIGRAIALRLAAEGADVVVNDLNSEGNGDWSGLPAVVDEIEALGRRSLGLTGSVTDASDVDRMVQTIVETFGGIDILVNNAAAPAGPDRVPVTELDESDFDLVQSVNVKGTFLCCRAVTRAMIERGCGGRIINTSSTAGKRGVARYAAYCASKFAVIGLTQALAMEVAPHNINVNVICPGLVDTERVHGIASGLKPDDKTTEEFRTEMLEQAEENCPLGRPGEPTDVAKTVAWLASDESDYLTGQAIIVSGGSLMM